MQIFETISYVLSNLASLVVIIGLGTAFISWRRDKRNTKLTSLEKFYATVYTSDAYLLARDLIVYGRCYVDEQAIELPSLLKKRNEPNPGPPDSRDIKALDSLDGFLNLLEFNVRLMKMDYYPKKFVEEDSILTYWLGFIYLRCQAEGDESQFEKYLIDNEWSALIAGAKHQSHLLGK